MNIKKPCNRKVLDDMAEKLVILGVVAVFFMQSLLLACII